MAKERLFHFHSELINYCYSSGRASVSKLSQTFIPAAIKRTDEKRGNRDAEITVEMPLDLQPAPQYLVSNPSRAIWLDVYQNDTSPTLKFSGKITQAEFDRKKYKAKLKARAIGEITKTEIPFRRFSNLCNHHLGDSRCGLDMEALKITVPASAFDGNVTITHADIGAESAGYFHYGYVQQGYVVAFVVNHDGNSVSLLSSEGLSATGSDISIYPGCDKTPDCCDSLFNITNFGGFPNIPAPDPISGEF